MPLQLAPDLVSAAEQWKKPLLRFFPPRACGGAFAYECKQVRWDGAKYEDAILLIVHAT